MLAIAAALAVASGALSCRKFVPTTLDLPDDEATPGAGLDITAGYLSDPEEIDHLFKAFLPDFGVLPLLVTVRNNDTVPLWIFSGNSMGLRDEFNGFTLSYGEKSVEPLQPLEVIERVKGMTEAADYRELKKSDAIAGTIVMPLGVFYAWKGYRFYRELRPLKKASLFSLSEGGMLEPVVLEPGNELSGYLFFPVDSIHSPYDYRMFEEERSGKTRTEIVHSLSEPFDTKFVLAVRPSKAPWCGKTGEAPDTPAEEPAIVQAVFPRPVICAAAGSAKSGPGQGAERILAIVEERGRMSLVLASADHSAAEGVLDGLEIMRFAGKSSSIADAVWTGASYACAVNFKRRSKLVAISTEKGIPVVSVEKGFERNIKRILSADGGVIVLLSDDFAHFVPFGGEDGEYWKLEDGIHDAVSTAPCDFAVFTEDRVCLYGPSGEDMVSRKRSIDLPRAKRRLAGCFEHSFALLHEGKGRTGDTLVVYDGSDLSETGRVAFRGKTVCAGSHGHGMTVQLEEGTLLDIRTDDYGAPYIYESGYLPDNLLALAGSAERITAIGRDGKVLSIVLGESPPKPAAGKREFTTEAGRI